MKITHLWKYSGSNRTRVGTTEPPEYFGAFLFLMIILVYIGIYWYILVYIGIYWYIYIYIYYYIDIRVSISVL